MAPFFSLLDFFFSKETHIHWIQVAVRSLMEMFGECRISLNETILSRILNLSNLVHTRIDPNEHIYKSKYLCALLFLESDSKKPI